ncbi:class I tRNA ligase family protein, partial [Acinetobacter baumannii]|uniref:class I tRNA ligase family protein n=1 Tax=Acinetobacter baumannii TaxID=470 RepID=UPI001D171704
MENDDILGPVQSNGVYVSDLPFFGGQFIWKANPAIVYERFAPVYLADYVETGAGTGIVHSAPAYGEDDF